MQRAMTGFTTDVDGHWVARLDCGHRQHVRHDPPLVEREWVTTDEGRRGRLGQTLDCVRCDAFEIPADAVVYKRTDDFTETTVPAGLRKDHATKSGVWGRIVVSAGRLRYEVPSPSSVFDLAPGTDGIVLPEVPHHVVPIGPVRFHVEFLRVPA
jgi:tellurite methyltransferase